MSFSARDMLRRLGAGESIAAVCEAAGIPRERFDSWWREETVARVPPAAGQRLAAVRKSVRIDRDRLGLPTVHAENDADLFFGFGYAQAQDRLFQLDFLRRRGAGRLAEILGPDGGQLDVVQRTVGFQNVFELDLLARTVGLRRIAEAEWGRLSSEVRDLLTAFSAGVNAVLEESRGRPPIEFDLLGYEPEPWTPIDCLTIEGEFRWYLTGRFPVIVLPELAKRALGDGPLYRAYLQNENDEESILHPGEYPTSRGGAQPLGGAMADPEAGVGSNNWVLAGKRTVSGQPLLASDPHIPFDANSCWYTVRLKGGSFDVAGAGYTGMPAVLFGRNGRVAWGVTNNICSQRDLYQERTDPGHPGCFLFDGQWEPARERTETIAVRGGASVTKTIRYSRNGPIVDDVLPPAARGTGPVALKWLGTYEGGWLTALLGMNRAQSALELREAIRPWHVPTFSVVCADDAGRIVYHAAGRIPIRKVWERGYRPGWDPAHQWAGLIPFEGMPHVADPPRGWLATANNRPAPNDFPFPLSGTWSEGLRAARIREMIEARPKLGRVDMAAMQHDVLSPRARRCASALAAVLEGDGDARLRQAAGYLKAWDGKLELAGIAGTIFDVFFTHWTRAVVRERFGADVAPLLAGGAAGLAARLLVEDWCGWFEPGRREAAIRTAAGGALDALATRLGPDMASWTWERVHVMPLRHVLSGRGNLAQLLDHGGLPVAGDVTTVCNTGFGGAWEARSGAGFRMIADFAERPCLWLNDAQGQSGHPGSPHYRDQLAAWASAEYHRVTLDDAMATISTAAQLTLRPR
jgi:penicillin amidase